MMQAACGTFAGTRDRSGWRLALVVLAAWTILALLQNWNSSSSDLAPLYLAGHSIAAGNPDLVYASTQARVGQTPPEWLDTIHAMGDPWPDAFPYLYPPLWAKLMSYVTPHVGPVAFNHAVAAWHMIATALSVVFAARIARPASMSPLIWVVLSVVLIQFTVFSQVAFHFNQPQITIMFLVLFAFERLVSGKQTSAGTLLGLAAAIKILPGIFVLLFLLDGKWRAAASFGATVAVLAGLSFMLAGPELHAEYIETLGLVRTALPLVPAAATAISAFVFAAHHLGLPIAELSHGGDYFNVQTLPALQGLLWAARVALLGSTIAFGLRLARRPSTERMALGLLALSIIVPIFGPMGWLHYYFISILLLPRLSASVQPGLAVFAYALFVAATSSTGYIQWVMTFGLDWTLLNIAVVGVWMAVLALIWRAAGKEHGARAAA